MRAVRHPDEVDGSIPDWVRPVVFQILNANRGYTRVAKLGVNEALLAALVAGQWIEVYEAKAGRMAALTARTTGLLKVEVVEHVRIIKRERLDGKVVAHVFESERYAVEGTTERRRRSHQPEVWATQAGFIPLPNGLAAPEPNQAEVPTAVKPPPDVLIMGVVVEALKARARKKVARKRAAKKAGRKSDHRA